MRFQKIIELTSALYRVTDLFPKNEPLRMQLREKANEILAEVVEYEHSRDGESSPNLDGKLQVMKRFLEVARTVGLVKPINVSVLEREYESLASALMAGAVSKSEESVQVAVGTNGLTERQKVIIAQVKQTGAVKISDFFATFPGVSAKTVQRDLQDLVFRNILKKEGERRWMSYKLL